MYKNVHFLRVNVKNTTFWVLLEVALLIYVAWGTWGVRVITDLSRIWVLFLAVAGVFIA